MRKIIAKEDAKRLALEVPWQFIEYSKFASENYFTTCLRTLNKLLIFRLSFPSVANVAQVVETLNLKNSS